MSDADTLNEHRQGKRRVSITKLQRESAAGAELLSLCQTITADGSFSDDEVSLLREWLDAHRNSDLPAIAHLCPIVERITADGQITPEERREIALAVEAVLPPDVRDVAKNARRTAEQREQDHLRSVRAAAKQQESDERARNAPVYRLDFMVAGVRFDGRPALIERYAHPLGSIFLVRDLRNQHSRNAIQVRTQSGHHIGFVPEEDAAEVAPLFDAGYPYAAQIKKILQYGRHPIPVVIADVFRQDCTLPNLVQPETHARASISYAQTQRSFKSRMNAEAPAPRSAAESVGYRLGRNAKIIAAIIALIVVYIVFRN